MPGTRDIKSNLGDVVFPNHLRKSPSLQSRIGFHGEEERSGDRGGGRYWHSRSATREPPVSPGDSAFPARSFTLAREIAEGRTEGTEAAEERNTLIMFQRRGYTRENKIRAKSLTVRDRQRRRNVHEILILKILLIRSFFRKYDLDSSYSVCLCCFIQFIVILFSRNYCRYFYRNKYLHSSLPFPHFLCQAQLCTCARAWEI